MAMQKSDELTDVAGLLFKQVTDIGIKTWTAGFNVWSEDNNSYVDYITSPNGGFIEPYTVYTDTAEALTISAMPGKAESNLMCNMLKEKRSNNYTSHLPGLMRNSMK
jgi:hypothetical protein